MTINMPGGPVRIPGKGMVAAWAAIEWPAERKAEAERAASARIMRARVRLMLAQPFFGALATRLEYGADWSHPSAWTDSARMGYNPAYVGALDPEEVEGLIAHEVMHIALGHVWRRGSRDGYLWNVAADFAVDPLLVEAGLRVPDATIDKKYTGRGAEHIYALLAAQLPSPKLTGKQRRRQWQCGWEGYTRGRRGPRGEAQKMPSQSPDRAWDTIAGGEVRDAPDPGRAAEREADWKSAVVGAAGAAKRRGAVPAWCEALVANLRAPRVNWVAELRRFFEWSAHADYSWRRPNPRYPDVYLPRMHSERMPPVVVALDTSGSMWTPETLTTLGSELSAILSETRPERVHVLHADAVVQHVETYEPGDELRLELRGGGGTDFRPVFEWVERQPDPPACLIYLTDGEGTFPAAPPAYPVLWAMVSDGSRRPPAPPFGLEVPIDAVWPVRAAASPQGGPA